MKQLFTTILFILTSFQFMSLQGLNAQGCVAIRHFSSCVGNSLENNLLDTGDMQLGINYRYFKSFRHFRGTEEEPDRISNGSEVINHSHAWDFFLTYGISRRWYVSVTLPTVINTRSSLYEHGRTERNTTFSRGLADIRMGFGYWLFNTDTHPRGNIAVGLGIKIPTGPYNASDIFYNVGPEGSPEVRPVDQSIQPGDGGFGFTLDYQLYQEIVPRLFLYSGGFYLVNPRETNGIRTFRETLNPILQNESIMSVPDQYSIRLGGSYSLTDKVTASIGTRFDAVPVKDIIGGNGGFRRPGNVLSVDPGLSFMTPKFSINLNIPLAIRRERPQSVTDRETEINTGNPRNGDAAFADYVINLSVAYRLSRQSIKLDPELQQPFKKEK